MTTPNQIAANRRNAQLSTGPKTKPGKERSRRNAWRHGLTAATIVAGLEDSRDYKAFEAAIEASYSPRSPVEHLLTKRLASLLWRLRRASAIEAGLFQIQADILNDRRKRREAAASLNDRTAIAVRRILAVALEEPDSSSVDASTSSASVSDSDQRRTTTPTDMAQCFLRLTNLNNSALERVSRYEAALWKQAAQTLLLLANVARPEFHQVHQMSGC
jgi:hypothetical protein